MPRPLPLNMSAEHHSPSYDDTGLDPEQEIIQLEFNFLLNILSRLYVGENILINSQKNLTRFLFLYFILRIF